MTIIRDCIAPDRNPKVPGIKLPEGSIDTHVHIFESQYPLFEGRGYNPPDSTLDDLKHLHSQLGVSRVVYTQPSPYGVDNSAILKGMKVMNDETPGRARGVCAITMDVTDNFLEDLDNLLPCFTLGAILPLYFLYRLYLTYNNTIT